MLVAPAPPVKVIILGTGGTCIDILDTIRDLADALPTPPFECVGFLDDDAAKWGQRIEGVMVLGPLRAASAHSDCLFVNGIGSPANYARKAEILARAAIPPHRFATIVHPTASVSRTATLGVGTVLFQHVTVTSNVRIGRHVVVLPQTVISHDCVIGDYSCIAGGVALSGGVSVGQSCYLGSKSVVRGDVALGDGCLIGMGSVVLHDVPEGTVVAGNPARTLRDA